MRQLRDAAQRLRAICEGRAFAELVADWQATAALERYFEIVGEAVKRLPTELREAYPAVPWKEIAGTRDHLSHGYDNVDHRVLWEAVEHDVPALLGTIEQMLSDMGDEAR